MTRVAIDAKFFPHIIDEIFSHASASTLLALRVNREWRERAERKVAYHVCVAQTVAETESLPRATPVLQAPEQEFLGILKTDSPESTAPTFLSFASVIDLQIPKLNKQVVPLLAHCSSDAIFRCHRLCHFATPANVTPKVRRVVLFATDSGQLESAAATNTTLASGLTTSQVRSTWFYTSETATAVARKTSPTSASASASLEV